MLAVFIKILLKFERKQLGKTKRHFLNEFREGEKEQMNNSTAGILLFQDIGHAINESFLYAKGFACINLSTLPNSAMRISGLISHSQIRKGCS